MPFSSSNASRSSLRRTGFTLTELMISVALALVLLVGINQVFKTTGQTVGTSYATLEGMRTQLALDNVLTPDFNKAVYNNEQPFILIHSESLTQFTDANEANADPFNDVTKVDLDGDGKTSSRGELATPADNESGRVHRADRIAFFARDENNPFHRQTGDAPNPVSNPPTLVASESSTEAFIWYGLLRLPANGSNLDPRRFPAGNYFEPAQLTTTAQQNQNNFYANQWGLGRQVILLESNPLGDHLDIDVNNSMGTANAPKVPPLSAESPAYSSGATVAILNNSLGNPWLAAHSRYDVAKTSIADYRSRMAVIDSIEPDTLWPTPPTTLCRTTWHISDSRPNPASHGNLDYAFNAKPWTDPTADRTAELATTTPFLTRGCSQFIIEWAGDYLTQDNNSDPTNPNYGTVTGIKPDGILDFIPDRDNSNRWTSATRWYGFPRNTDTTNDNLAAGVIIPGSGQGVGATNTNTLTDVVPLRDVIAAALKSATPPQVQNIDPDYCVEDPSVYGIPTFIGKNYPGKKCPERDVPIARINYANPTTGLPANSNTGQVNTATGKAVYVAAWGPQALSDTSTTSAPGTHPGPWLVRVILNVRDRNGRLPNGQTLEHVYSFRK